MKNSPSKIRGATMAVIAGLLWAGGEPGKLAAQNTSPASLMVSGPALPYGAGEVVKLYQSGIARDTIINFIDSSALPYHLNADQIISLQKMGIPDDITRTMIQRDGSLQQQAAQQQYYQQQSMARSASVTQQPPPVVTPSSPAPDVTVIGSSYPAYDFTYPYYDSGYWPVVIGGGWGWGWGWNGRGWGWGWGHGFHGGYGGFHGGFHGGGFGGFHGGVGGFHAGGGFHGGGGFGGGHGGGHR